MVVFQPHTYSRTKAYLDDFASVLGAKRNGVKTVAIMPTYAARERLSDGVDSDVLFNAISTNIANEAFIFSKERNQLLIS